MSFGQIIIIILLILVFLGIREILQLLVEVIGQLNNLEYQLTKIRKKNEQVN